MVGPCSFTINDLTVWNTLTQALQTLLAAHLDSSLPVFKYNLKIQPFTVKRRVLYVTNDCCCRD